jgi:hypothetical protein
MTTLNEAKVAIVSRFIDTFTGASTARILLQNEDEEFTNNSDENWVRLSVVDQSRTQETLGKKTNRKYRSGGQIFVQVYTATDTGVKSGDIISTEARDIFEGESFSGVDCNNGLIRPSGANGKWYQHLVEIDFDYEDIK